MEKESKENLKKLLELEKTLKFIKDKNVEWFGKIELLYDDNDFSSYFEKLEYDEDDFQDYYALARYIRDDKIKINNFNLEKMLIVLSRPYDRDFSTSDIYINVDDFCKAIKDYDNINFKDYDLIISNYTSIIPINISEQDMTTLLINSSWDNPYGGEYVSFSNDILEFDYNYEGSTFKLSLIMGFSLYSLSVLDDHNYNSYDSFDVFIKVESEDLLQENDKELLIGLTDSFLYFLIVNDILTGHRIEKIENPDIDYYLSIDLDISNSFEMFFDARTSKLMHIYNSALISKDEQFKVIQYHKILEAVSEKVEDLQLIKDLRTLSNNDHIHVGSSIRDIRRIVNSNRSKFNSQEKQLKQLLLTIFTNDEVLNLPIPDLIMRDIDDHNNESKIVSKITKVIVATRNNIAHGKLYFETSHDHYPNTKLFEYIPLLDSIITISLKWYYETDLGI